jgi:predicted phage baseplate assembly protein
MPLPIPDLDDKTFNELFEEARALIPRYAPEWTEHNLSDPGITFIDLFAWLAEMQIFYLNRVTDRNFLKFLRLLGEAPNPAKSAKADVTFELQENNPPLTIPKGVRVAATDPVSTERIVFETDEDVFVHTSTLRRVLSYSSGRWSDNTAANNAIGVFYFAFGADPMAGDSLYLGFGAEAVFPTEEINLIVNVFDADLSIIDSGERTGSRPNVVPSAELEWQYWNANDRWNRLQKSDDDDTVSLTRNGSLRFKGPDDIAKAKIQDIEKDKKPVSTDDLYWLRAFVKTPGYEIPPRVATIALNTVSATHGKTIVDERASSNGLPFQRIKLKNKPVLNRTVELRVMEEDGTWKDWTEVNDFDASGPESPHFTVNLPAGLLKFGDGIHGRIPPAMSDDRAAAPVEGNLHVPKYRVGGGEKGNVQAKMIGEILDETLSKKVKIVNRRPAVGGAEPEILDKAKSRVRRNFKQVTRGITTADFKTLTSGTPGIRIARVEVLPQYHPKLPAIQMPGAVTVVVVPEVLPASAANSRKLPVPSKGFLQNVSRHLKSKAIASTNLSVVGPEFIQVTVDAAIRVDPRLSAESVRRQVLDELERFLDPLTGGDDGQGWPFGRPVYRSEIYQHIEGVPGVICVDRASLSGKRCDSTLPDRITIRKTGLVYSGEHEIRVC